VGLTEVGITAGGAIHCDAGGQRAFFDRAAGQNGVDER